MSDGNFHRSLLPHTPYQSGLKMGKAMAREYAISAFRDYMRETHPALSADEVALRTERFSSLLSAYPF